MDLPVALHTAARRFCMDRHDRWSGEYMRLVETGGDRLGATYTKAAYCLFPRYRLDKALEIEVERVGVEELDSMEGARKLLVGAGSRAFSLLHQEFKNSPGALVALADEWTAFEAYVNNLDHAQLVRIEPLPYRRVLTKHKSDHVRNELRARWGVHGYWYPLAKCGPDLNVIAFHQDLWEQRDGTSQLIQALQERGVERCFLLLEGPVDYEIDRVLVDASYQGDEAFVTSDFEWLVYCSHESSISVAGWLADFFRKQWQDWESVAYGGPFHTENLRGTWKHSSNS